MGALWDKAKALDYNNVFSYSTVKFVVIKDKRLGVIHHVLQFAIFVYIVLYNILYEQRYLLLEPPYGNIRATLREPPEWTDGSLLPYCLQNQTTYQGFQNFNCAYITGIDLPYPAAQENAVLVTTRIKDTYYATPPNCTGQTNPATSFSCRPGKNSTGSTRYFIADIERYTIFMEHAIFGRQSDLVVSNADCNGKLLFRNGSKNAIVFPPDNRTGDILPISTLVNAANIKSLDDPSGLGSSYRYDGVLIVVVITYKNYITKPMKLHYTYQFYEIPKQDVVNQEPSVQVSPSSTMQRNYYGVRFVFLVVGQIGVFDFPTLLTSLVNGVVLIKLATVVVDMLILYIMPEKQEYTKHKFETAFGMRQLVGGSGSTTPIGNSTTQLFPETGQKIINERLEKLEQQQQVAEKQKYETAFGFRRQIDTESNSSTPTTSTTQLFKQNEDYGSLNNSKV